MVSKKLVDVGPAIVNSVMQQKRPQGVIEVNKNLELKTQF